MPSLRSASARRSFQAVGLAAAAALLAAACGGSPSSPSTGGTDAAGSDAAKAAKAVYDKFNAMKGEARTKALVEAANAEGALSIYTSNTDIDKVVDAFEDKYPDIDVSVYRANSETVLQRVVQEQSAGFYGNDVLETNAGELGIAGKDGYLAEYQSELRDRVRPEGRHSKDWTASRFNVFVVGWNTNLVKPGEEPKSLEELADPKWKGKVSMELSDLDWFAAMYDYYKGQGKSDADILDLFARLAANAKIVKGHTVQGELLSAGQFAVAVSAYSHTIDKAADEGAPVTWRPEGGTPVQPLVTRPNGVATMRTAKHPAAAALFVDFELTDTQEIFHKAFRIGAIPTAEDPLAGLQTVAVPDERLLTELKKWDDLYAEVVQKGQQID